MWRIGRRAESYTKRTPAVDKTRNFSFISCDHIISKEAYEKACSGGPDHLRACSNISAGNTHQSASGESGQRSCVPAPEHSDVDGVGGRGCPAGWALGDDQ